LTICLLGNLCLLGAYGIINHFVTGSQLVLWSDGYEQYWKDNRASGSYYCPDHFAGALEMGLALGLGILLDRAKTGRWKLAASITCLIAVTGIIMSKSRGAGLTLIVVCVSAMIFGFAQWPSRARWRLRSILATAMIVILGVLFFFPSLYMDRFTSYFSVNTKVEQKILPAIFEKVRHTSRGVMISAALRAWEEQPVFGIGPGMHRNLWPHIAATPDGDRELGIWPSRTNNRTHSYHVHSDWVQLLQEYGSVGFMLLLIPVTGGFLLFGMIIHRESKREKITDSTRRANGYFAASLGGFLAYIAMLFHSLGDFNLQIPANTWLFAVVLAIPIGFALGRRNPADSERR
ncbi:MAG: O-antigen ligase family protein, partial [Verrucomicrobiota bacterium]